MIFVTVGTHEQQFNRLVEYIDNLKKNGFLKEDVFMQIGFSTYDPQYCEWSRLLTYQQMEKNISDAHIVITHGGPSSFMFSLQAGKIPIVVPRQKQFGEHINDHQVDFTKQVEERYKSIIVVEEISHLKEILDNYDKMVESKSTLVEKNNVTFNKKLEEIVRKLVAE